MRVAYAIADTFNSKAGDTFFLLLCQQDADKFDPDACRRLLDYCYEHSNGQTTFGTIIYLARKVGYSPDKVKRVKKDYGKKDVLIDSNTGGGVDALS